MDSSARKHKKENGAFRGTNFYYEFWKKGWSQEVEEVEPTFKWYVPFSRNENTKDSSISKDLRRRAKPTFNSC